MGAGPRCGRRRLSWGYRRFSRHYLNPTTGRGDPVRHNGLEGWLLVASAQEIKNLFSSIPGRIPAEIIEILVRTDSFHLERIVSGGQQTAPGTWYDQEANEWVVLLSGSAGLLFEGEAETRVMRPGDYLQIPAHCRHRVEWTDPQQPTVWLALHYR